MLFLARLHPKKGVEHLIRAMATTPECANSHLVIAGQGEHAYTKVLTDLAIELKVQDRCHFIGFVGGSEKNTVLLGADLYCLPSSNENFGISVLEALNAGCPVVLSSEVALAQAVQSNQLGLIVEVTKLSSKLGAAVAQLLQSPRELQSVGHRARQHVLSHYSWNETAKQLTGAYTKLLASDGTLDS